MIQGRKARVALLLIILITAAAALHAAEYAASTALKNLLGKEIQEACGGEFIVDSMNFSLPLLKAEAKNARIVHSGTTEVFIPRIVAHFSLRDFAQHKLLLSHLRLYQGDMSGIGPSSAIYKVVDHLAEPLPPELDYPGRWKIKLQRLDLYDAAFQETLAGKQKIHGKNVSLAVQRLQDDSFYIRPRIGMLELPETFKGNSIELGELEAGIVIHGQSTSFRDLQLVLNNAWANVDGRLFPEEDNRLEANLDFQADDESLGLQSYLAANLSGSATVKGTIENPEAAGSFNTSQGCVFAPGTFLSSFLRFKSVSGTFKAKSEDKGAHLEISAFKATSPKKSLALSSPLILSKRGISGAFKFQLASLKIGDITLGGMRSVFSLSGPLTDPQLEVNGTIKRVDMEYYHAPPLKFSATLRDQKLNLTLANLTEKFGSLKSTAKILLQPGHHPLASEISLKLDSFSLLPSKKKKGRLKPLELSGSGNFQGLLLPNSLEGEVKLQVISQHFSGEAALQGKLNAQSGEITAALKNPRGSLNSTLRITPHDGRLTLNLKDFKPVEYAPGLQCIKLGLDLDYHFQTLEPLLGSGRLLINEASVGCGKKNLSLINDYKAPIRKGKLNLKNLNIKSEDANLGINGSVSLPDGYNLSANGVLKLASLQSFLPAATFLRGRLSGNAQVEGPFSSPRFRGNVTITAGEISFGKTEIRGNNIDGHISCSRERCAIKRIDGQLNGGSFEATGTFTLPEASTFNINLAFENSFIEPTNFADALLSGNLTLTAGPGRDPVTRGKIKIESGEIKHHIDLRTLIPLLADYFANKRQSPFQPAPMPSDMELALNLSATRGVFITTNWGGGELRGELEITGKSERPRIEGELQTVSGWFSLQDKMFNITSGRLLFEPFYHEPRLELLAESSLRTRTGEDSFVFLEANGPLSDPRILLTSTSGLSQKEILTYITKGGVQADRLIGGGATPLATVYDQASGGERPGLSLQRLLGGLTRIDKLSVSSQYNEETGSIEPAVLAQKQISGGLSAIGESFVGQGLSQGKLGLLYRLSPNLRALASAETMGRQEETTLEANISYTVLAAHEKFLNIDIHGNETFDRAAILDACGLTPRSRLPSDEVLEISNAVKRLYSSRAFFGVKVGCSCQSQGRLCRRLILRIREGSQTYISDVIVNGINNDLIPAAKIKDKLINKPASTSLLEETTNSIRTLYAQKGYIGTSVRYSLQRTAPDSVQVAIAVHSSPRTTFEFTGNNAFSKDELLQTTDLFERKTPFSDSTLNVLLQNIERKYREAGFLLATVGLQDKINSANQTTYVIEVREEDRMEVREVEFEGNGHLNKAALKELVIERDPELCREIFKPQFAVAERLNTLAKLLTHIYNRQGFPDARISPQIDIREGKLVVRYIIKEGPRVLIDQISFIGLPPDTGAPTPSKRPMSIPEANRFLETVHHNLVNNGFLLSSLSTKLDPHLKKLAVGVSPGPQTVIEDIILQSDANIPDSDVLKHISIQAGDPWRNGSLNSLRRTLLQLGLFSRVETGPADGVLDSPKEVLLIKLTGRPLSTLEIGGGANSAYGLHFFGEATDRAIFRDGTTLALRTDLYYEPEAASHISQGIANLRMNVPEIFDNNLTLTEDLRFQKIETRNYEYDLDRISLASYFNNNGPNQTAAAGYTILQESLDNVSEDAVIGEFDTGTVNIGFLSGFISFDYLDDPLFPTDGYSFSLNARLAAKPLASDAEYTSIGGRATVLYPLLGENSTLTLASNTHIASSWSFGNTSEIPISQRYYLGGSSSVRGFRENSLGPLGKAGSVIGGDTLFSESIELRYRAMEDLSLHIFFDTGSVWLKERTISIKELRESTGMGMRYLSPLGPIGFDIGVPIDERSGEPSVRFHFAIGSNF